MVSTLEANKMSKDRESAPWHLNLFRKHRHAHIHTTHTHSEARREGRKRKFEARSIYSLKSSLPHLFHWGYISCAGLNLAAKWQVPLCSNTGVFRGSEPSPLHATRREPCSSSEKTHETQWTHFCFPAVFFFSSSSSRKVIITQSVTICYTILSVLSVKRQS